MKRIPLFLFSLFLLTSLFVGCDRLDAPTQPTDNGGNQSTLLMKVNGVEAANEFTVERNVATVFTIFMSRLKSVSTRFHDDNTVKTGEVISHTFRGQSQTSMTVTAVDSSNNVTEKTYTVNISVNIYLPLKYAFGKSQNGNKWDYKVILLRSILDQYPGDIAHIGDHTSWVATLVPSQDLDKNYINGQVVDAPAGQGKYFQFSVSMAPGSYTFAGMKGGIWGPYGDSNKVHYTIDANGDWHWDDTTSIALPGETGDQGVNAVSRYGVRDPGKVTVYVNNFAAYNGNYFVRMQDTAGVFLSPLSQSPVQGYPNWGKIEIPASSIPASGTLKLSFNYGSQIGNPSAFNSRSSESQFYYAPEGVLKIIIQRLGLPKASGSEPRDYYRITIQ